MAHCRKRYENRQLEYVCQPTPPPPPTYQRAVSSFAIKFEVSGNFIVYYYYSDKKQISGCLFLYSLTLYVINRYENKF